VGILESLLEGTAPDQDREAWGWRLGGKECYGLEKEGGVLDGDEAAEKKDEMPILGESEGFSGSAPGKGGGAGDCGGNHPDWTDAKGLELGGATFADTSVEAATEGESLLKNAQCKAKGGSKVVAKNVAMKAVEDRGFRKAWVFGIRFLGDGERAKKSSFCRVGVEDIGGVGGAELAEHLKGFEGSAEPLPWAEAWKKNSPLCLGTELEGFVEGDGGG
jgi:hypothetical protein